MASAAHSSSAATEPHVPGPGFNSPDPKNVAIVHAQGVLRLAADVGVWIGVGLVLFTF